MYTVARNRRLVLAGDVKRAIVHNVAILQDQVFVASNGEGSCRSRQESSARKV
jgi:hypothetical protein